MVKIGISAHLLLVAGGQDRGAESGKASYWRTQRDDNTDGWSYSLSRFSIFFFISDTLSGVRLRTGRIGVQDVDDSLHPGLGLGECWDDRRF